MENAVFVHVLDRFEQLVDVEFDAGFWQVRSPPLDGFVEVHFHELEDEGEASRWLVTRNIKMPEWNQSFVTLTKALRSAG